MTYRQYVNICIGSKDRQRREDKFNRALLYNTIKGWADPKQFTMSIERFWPIDDTDYIQAIMPTQEQLIVLDQRFRSFGRRDKWQE